MLLLVTWLCAVLSVLGALLDAPLLAGFGNRRAPIQPVAALAYCAIAAALYAARQSRLWLSDLLLAIPVAVVVLTLVQTATGLPLIDGNWWQAHGILPALGSLIGRPAAQTTINLTLLALAAAMTARSPRGVPVTAAALALVTLGISAMSGAVVLLGMTHVDAQSSNFLPSLPATIQAIALSVAILIWGGWPKWGELPGKGTQEGKVLRRAFPIIMGVPAVNALIEVTIDQVGSVSPLVVDVVVAGVNIAVFGSLILWAIARISAEHAALWETTNAMDSAPIVLTSTDGIIRHWSRGCEELYGWTAKEAVGRSKYEFLHARDAQPPFSPVLENVETDRERELIERRRDGSLTHVLEQVRLVQADGRPPVLVHKMTDVTERVRMEAALEESDANLALALNAAQIGTNEWDIATGRVVASSGLEQRFGLQPGDLGQLSDWVDRIDPNDMAAVFATIDAAVSRNEERCDFKYRMTVPNGGVRALEGSARLVYDEQGALAKVVGVHVDVTDRNERESALLAQQEQFRLVLKTVPSAMVICDAHGVIKAFSASAEQLYGYSAEQAIGANVAMLTAQPDEEHMRALLDSYLAKGSNRMTARTPMTHARRSDGSLVPIEMWAGDMQIGEHQLFAGFARDLTERLAAEERLAEMRDELLHVSRLSVIGEMAASLAHELNQPLAATVYFLGAADRVLAEPANREQGRSLLRMGSDQALRAGEIIRSMRSFATKDQIDKQVVPIRGIIEDAVSLAFLGGSRYEIELLYDFGETALSVFADRVQIGQVLVNLLRNATDELRKMPRAARRITIGTRPVDDDTIEVSVADSGPGLDDQMLAQLYMPFVSTKHEDGMGLGLSICRRIIEAHGGTLEGANCANGGALFRFTLTNVPA
ncbi:PAS domain S-box protein [Sphingomonas sp. RB3P16]|uniref:PAS domain-containing sensor histidine kinase n=1 Tax=Parasphingomonas frigoris TaxID=3096163 RepID=UPI002FC673EA